jgi:beta-glucosidase
MRKLTIVLASCLLFTLACSKQENKAKECNQFVDELMAKMTLEEKIGQLNQCTSRWEMTGPAPSSENTQRLLEDIKNGKVGSMLNVNGAKETREAQKLAVQNSRLGIPLLFGYDVIHGYKTMFPIPLAEASSWEPELAKLSAQITAKETAASGVHWTFAPMMDVGRDARWGRVMEGCGEDPYLASIFSVARVNGFQGTDLSKDYTIAACAKHFAGYAFSESGKDYNTVDIGTYTLHNIVLPPFKAVAKAGVASFMNSFNLINATPSTANSYLQRDLLKGEWNYEGFIVSDWASIKEIATHGAAEDLKEAAQLAINAGCDMDMESHAYPKYLKELLSEGKVDEKQIDDAARRILKIKYKLGLFEDPYKYSNKKRERELVYNQENRTAARSIAKRSMVLLKNEEQLLPLSKQIKSIALIGPLAADKDIPLGSWRAKAIENSAVSLLEGIQTAVSPQTKINYSKGCNLSIGDRGFRTKLTYEENDKSGFPDAIKAAQNSEVVIMALGEDCWQTGEARSQTDIRLKGQQLELFNAIRKVNKKIIVVLMNGRPIAIPEIAENAGAILESWFAGSEAGNAIADVLFGDYNPAGKLTMSFPRNVGQCPIYYNYMNTGRPLQGGNVFWSHFTDSSNTPLYPFGYGLSYTTFEYDPISINRNHFTKTDSIKVSFTLNNTGKFDGEEVVQLYIQDPKAKYARPVKELKAFQKIELNKNQSKQILFTLSSSDLAYYSPKGEFLIESGTYYLYVGTNSQDVQKVSFILLD